MPWNEASRRIVEPRECAVCGCRLEPPLRIGWTPVAGAWRCPACSRAYERRIDALARWLLRGGDRSWLAAAVHREHDGCERCDVARRATQLLLSRDGGYERPSRRS